jgi:hypothetical protein
MARFWTFPELHQIRYNAIAHHDNIAEILRKCFENIARILRKTILSEYCQNIAWLTHIAKLLESPNHQCSSYCVRIVSTQLPR